MREPLSGWFQRKPKGTPQFGCVPYKETNPCVYRDLASLLCQDGALVGGYPAVVQRLARLASEAAEGAEGAEGADGVAP